MEVITIESEAYKNLISKIDQLHNEIIRIQNPVDQFAQEWIDSYDVMKMLNISRRTLYNYMNQGKLKSSRIGKRNFFRVQEVKEIFHQPEAIKADKSAILRY